ncbi:type IV toxin-antitoxin system AbiEi family antitoxin domain-containing protein [Gordonia sp. KTR9]|uniref:type IV toxin-antitoxin system AbiEi family antitoxin domain-containing protein n=1 Tax=Gordonia sp. KTR9 TaxID=337191 RepID=UPI00030C82D0|nr:type IV toxin-antitoxin system AbiEi family antitoxin domain-containing protein [Gordonia sp. KTR9]
MSTFPTDRHGLIRRETTLRLGIGDDVVSSAVKRGELVRLAPGVCVTATDDADDLYRLRSVGVATSARDHESSILSHDSAAAVFRLSLLHPKRERVHLTRIEPGAGFVRGLRAVHAGPVTAEWIVEVDGIRLTSLERTAVDVAMAGDFAQALVVFDRAFAADADVTTMAHLIESRRRWRGAGIARRALSFADGASESVGESWSRAQMIEAGFPMPRLQHTFQTDVGPARTDFDWDAILVGEFDGLQKYGRLLRPGETPRDALIREKRREDALRAQGIMVIRWTWGTLVRGELADLLRPWLDKLAAA